MSRGTHVQPLGADDFERFLHAVGDRLAGKPSAATLQVRKIDDKPFTVAVHFGDHHATHGHGVRGRKARGYKLHAI